MNKENQEQINLILDKMASEFEQIEMRDLIEEIKKLINENIELKHRIGKALSYMNLNFGFTDYRVAEKDLENILRGRDNND